MRHDVGLDLWWQLGERLTREHLVNMAFAPTEAFGVQILKAEGLGNLQALGDARQVPIARLENTHSWVISQRLISTC